MKIPENMKNRTFLDLWHIGAPEILLKLFILLKPGLVKVVQDIFQNNRGQGSTSAQKWSKNRVSQSFERGENGKELSKLLKNSQNCLNPPKSNVSNKYIISEQSAHELNFKSIK